jgi:hypothetical protein
MSNSRVLYSDLVEETPITVPAEGASGVTIADVYSVDLPPSKDHKYIRVTAMVELYQSATATAQNVTFDIRAAGKAKSVAEDVSFIHTVRNGIIDRQLLTYEALIEANGGGTCKFQVYGATSADAQVTITGKGFMVEAVSN